MKHWNELSLRGPAEREWRGRSNLSLSLGIADRHGRQTTGDLAMTALICLLAFAGMTVWADSPNDAFFPMQKGTQWVYNTVQKEDKSSFEMKVVIQGPWQDGDLSGVIMTQKDERGTMRQFLFKTDKGIWVHKMAVSKSYTPEATMPFTPALPFVIFPLTPGTKVHWEGRMKIAFVNKPIVFDGEVVGWEDIDVPAGHYHCMKLHLHELRGKEVVDENVWYAEGVGQVKYDGGQYVKELKSYRRSDGGTK